MSDTSGPRPDAGDAFAGFWMGGYEGADHVNSFGEPLDMLQASGHLERLDEDHRRAARLGLSCVRESIGWRLAEAPGGAIDLSRALRIEASARRHGLQVLWTLMHYGLPGDLSLHDNAMIPRLARFAAAAARVLGRQRGDRPPVFTPVNEIGFLAWAASQQHMLMPPNNWVPTGDDAAREGSRISGYVVKRRLAQAAIAAMVAIRAERADARFLHIEPLVHVVAPRDRADLQPLADTVRSWQWQAWDLISGRAEPGLGGGPEWLDLIGVNHYHSSQWEVDTEHRLDWATRDARRAPLGRLLIEVDQRYGRPLIVGETSHVGVGRADWLHEVAAEVRSARAAGAPVQGLCVYPLVDRPDWQHQPVWHRSGVWHVEGGDGPNALARHVDADVQAALRQWQAVLPAPAATTAPTALAAPPRLVVFSHLRWHLLRHRTRHLMSRLAGRWRIAFVEEPLACRAGEPAWLDVMPAGPWLDVLVPHTPLAAAGFDAHQQPVLQSLLEAWNSPQSAPVAVVWLTTPMAHGLARALDPECLVYDCADELAAFVGAPTALPALEAELLACAHRVFVPGNALAAPRAALARERLHLLPNGFERHRFAARPAAPAHATRAIHRAGWEAAELRCLPLPTAEAGMPRVEIGYAGAIDERLDLPLLQALADARPQWDFVLVGPVLKIDAATLPQRPNLHWLGNLPYRLLPALMARWRLALLPFALEPSTRHAQPLKVFEALAAGLPVVAPPLSELLDWHAAGVHCGAGSMAMLRACEAALAETALEAAARRRHARARLAGRDWQTLGDQADALLRTALAERRQCARKPEHQRSSLGVQSTLRLCTSAGTGGASASGARVRQAGPASPLK